AGGRTLESLKSLRLGQERRAADLPRVVRRRGVAGDIELIEAVAGRLPRQPVDAEQRAERADIVGIEGRGEDVLVARSGRRAGHAALNRVLRKQGKLL